ncbi:hypothetical protein C8054_14825 [Micromonospora sp. RP3T]|nr:hypothetical protein C8054_14825 [Micromonospora sp. RP3T]
MGPADPSVRCGPARARGARRGRRRRWWWRRRGLGRARGDGLGRRRGRPGAPVQRPTGTHRDRHREHHRRSGHHRGPPATPAHGPPDRRRPGRVHHRHVRRAELGELAADQDVVGLSHGGSPRSWW